MPEVKAFQALRYDTKKFSPIADVLAPPYDVISPAEQEKFHQKNPHNVIRLILGKEKSGDTVSSNKYTRAGEWLAQWTQSGVLTKEVLPSIYVYVQDYLEEGKKKRRVGFMAAMKIDEKAVLRHENTLASPKKDRMALLKSVRTNLSPIFGLFEDPKAAVQKTLEKSLRALRPAIDAAIDGVRHRLYVESRPEAIRAICLEMKKKPMFIADGHHRFEVACQFRRWMLGQRKDHDAGWNYVMTYFSDCQHNPFKIFPTHRLVNVPAKVDVLAALRSKGTLQKAANLGEILRKLSKNREETADKKYAFGIYSKKHGFYILTLSHSIAARVKQNPVDKLDVAVLHKHLIEPGFGIRAIEKSNDIDFTRDAQVACRKVSSGEFDLAIFLRPTSLKEMIVASKKGLKMPQKSTYFYPKLLSGLAFHRFDD